MKYTLLYILCSFSIALYSMNNTPIRPITSLSECSPDIENCEIIFCDLDDTLMVPQEPLMRNINTTQRTIFFNFIEVYKQHEILNNLQYRTVEPNTKEFIETLQKKIPVIGFTFRHTDAAYKGAKTEVEITHNQLKSAGIQLTTQNIVQELTFEEIEKIAPYSTYKRSMPILKDNILFSGYYEKNLVLKLLLQKLNFYPKILGYIDDNIRHINGVARMIEEHNKINPHQAVLFKGYYYQGAALIDNTIDHNITKLQLQYLNAEGIFYSTEQIQKKLAEQKEDILKKTLTKSNDSSSSSSSYDEGF